MNILKDNRSIEALTILVYKHDIHTCFFSNETEMEKYEVLMYLSDRYSGEYPIPYETIVGDKMPDICGSCLAYFGHTYGGRLRSGCHICHDKTTGYDRLLDLGRMIGTSPYDNIDAVVVNTIYKYQLYTLNFS